MSRSTAAEAVKVPRKAPVHVNPTEWLDSLGPKHLLAAVVIPGVMDRIKAGLRARRDVSDQEARVARLEDERDAARIVLDNLRDGAAQLDSIAAELAPIVAVLPEPKS